MHHLRSRSSVRRFRLAAVMLVGMRMLAPAACGLVVVSLTTHNRGLTMLGAELMAFTMLLVVGQWSAAAGTCCPLCRVPVLAPKQCAKHRRARTVIGSHRLRVALQILFLSRFRCPYCNESTAVAHRETVFRSPSRRSHPD